MELSQNCTLTITAESTGRLSAEGGAAGIGSTKGRTSGKITINGGTVEAVCTYSGPGIGTYEWYKDLGDEAGELDIPEDITINGGIVIAKGVSNGAGIGSGNNPSGAITINGGVVIAEGGESATGIGSGSGALGRNEGFIHINNNAVVFATKGKFSQNHIGIYGSGISAKVFKQAGVIFEGKTGVMYGSIAATENFTVPAEHTLTIKKGETLNIPKGLTNNGTIINGGIINGAVSGNQPKRINPAAHDMSSGELTLNADCGSCGGHMVTGTTTTASILVQGGTHNVTLKDVEITQAKGAFEMQNGCTVNLTLLGDNVLTSGEYFAGLAVNVGNTLNITEKSTGSLTAVGGRGTAGIGGGFKGIGGTITIKGGTVTATGGSAAAGIGSGNCSNVEPKNAGTISLLGGVVTAIGGEDAAGIGGGRNSQNNNIIIDGGVVFAMGSGRDHIGLGEAAPDVTCTISRNGGIIFEGVLGLLYDTAVSTTFDFTIPSTHTLSVNQDKTLTISSGTTLHNEGQIIQSGTINVNGKITGNQPIKPVTTHDISSSDMNLYISCGGTTCIGHTVTGTTTVNRIIVEGGIHNITLNGVSIDVSEIDNTCAFEIKNDATVNLTLTGSNILKSGQNKAGLRVSSDETLVITAASTGFITVTGGRDAAGIGGDNHEYSGTITINAGTINAIGNDNGAGIGGGNGGGGNTISITGGTINATGGSDSAGIGGGHREEKRGGGGGDINITGGTVTATGDGEGTGIGEGGAAASERTIVTISDTAVVFATKGDKATNHIGRWRINISNSVTIDGGIVFQGGSGSVYSDFTLQNDFIINPNQSLNINAGKTLTIPNGKTLYNYGALFLGRGTTLTGNGTLVGDGIFNVLLEESDIVAPDQVYTGNAIEPEIVLSSHTVMEKEFTTVTTGYTKTYENNIDVGEAAVVYTEDSDTPETIKKTFAITQSDTAFTGGVKTYKGESEQSTFTYGEIITVKVTPTATGTAPAIKGRAVPIANQLALFKGDVQLTEPQNVTSGTPLTFAIHTADKQLAIGENTITAKYVAGANMAAHEDSVNVTLKPKPLTGEVTAKVYDGNTDFMDAVLTLNTVIVGDIVTATVTGKVEDAKAGKDKIFTLESVNITGLDKELYILENAAISGTVTITPAAPVVEVTAVKGVSRLRDIIGNHDDTLDLTANITGVPDGTVPAGTVTFKSGTTEIAADVPITDGIAACKWQTPPAGTNIVVTAEFAPEENSNYRTVTGMSDAFDIDQVEQKTLKITDIPEKTYGDEAFTLEANGGSGTGVVSYASSNTSVLTISEDQATIVGQGDVTITATKAGDNDYKEATATYEITVGSATPTIEWGSTTQEVTYTGKPAVITQPTVTLVKGETYFGEITYSYTAKASPSNLFGLFEEKTSALPTAAGMYEVTAHTVEFGNYTAAQSDTMILTIEKTQPTLLIGHSYASREYVGTPIPLPTEANMVLTGVAFKDVTFAYSTNADMSGSTKTPPTNAGNYYVQASVEDGDNTYAAQSVAKDFEIIRIHPVIMVTTNKTAELGGKEIVVTVKITSPAGATTGFPTANEITITPTNATEETPLKQQGTTGVYTATYKLADYSEDIKAKFKANVPNVTTNYIANTSGTTAIVTILDKYTPTVVLISSNGTPTYRDSVTLTATVGKDGRESPLAGTVQFKKDGNTLGESVTIDADGKAAFTLEGEPLQVGDHSFTAEFTSSEGSDYKDKTSDACTVKVKKADMNSNTTIEGIPKFDEELTANTSHLSALDGDDLGGFIYQWNRSGDGAIEGATSSTYTVTEADIGKSLTVIVTPQNTNYAKKTSDICLPQKADSTVEITGDLDKSYDGAAESDPTITQTGSDGAVTFAWYKGRTELDSAPKDAGDYTVKAILAANNTHADATSEPKTFTISKKEVTTLTIAPIVPQDYTGSQITPTVTVTVDGNIIAATDYIVEYGENINAGTDASSVTVKAATGGNYSFDEVKKNFTINKIAYTDTAITGDKYVVQNNVETGVEFDLSSLSFPAGFKDRSYDSVAIGTNTDGLITGTPSISGTTVKFDVAAVAKGKTGVLNVTVKSINYNDYIVAITVRAVEKTPVNITGLTAAANLFYSGSAQKGYTGNINVEGNHVPVNELVYTYTSTDGGGYNSTTPPTNAGDYKLVVSIADSNASYRGSHADILFTIGKKAVTVNADNQTMLKNGTTPAFTVTYTGFVGAENESNAALATAAVASSLADGTTVGNFDITLSTQAALNNTVGKNYNITEQNNGTLTVNEITHGITASAGTGGTISPIGTVTVTDGASQTFTITANSSYSIADVTVDGESQGAISTYTFSNVTGNHTIFATFNYNGGGSTGGSGNGGGGSNTPAPPVVTAPILPENGNVTINPSVDKDGNATVTVSDNHIDDAIKKAQDEAKKNGTEKNGIAVTITLDTNTTLNSFTTNLPKSTQEKLIAAGVTTFTIDGGATITFDLEAIKQIKATANTDVTVTATKTAANTLSKEAQAATGGRPVYDFKVTGGGKTITTFGTGKLSLSIPYELQKADGNGKPSATGSFENPGNLVGVYIDTSGGLTYLPGSSYNVASKAMLISTTHLSVYGVAYKTNAPTFTDTATHWAKDDIQFVAARGLLTGTTATTFSPNSSMTRGMFVTALGRLAGVDPNSYKTGSFTDVKTDAYYAPYVNWAVQNNIVTGTSATTFAPDSAITRQEMAVMTANYAKTIGYKLPSVHKEIIFTDSASIGTWAKTAVKEMQMAGILMGKDGGKFDPTGTASRAEVSAMLRRFVELVANSESAEGWVTNDSGNWMYFEDGKAVTGKKKIDGTTYEFDRYGVTALLPKDRRYAV